MRRGGPTCLHWGEARGRASQVAQGMRAGMGADVPLGHEATGEPFQECHKVQTVRDVCDVERKRGSMRNSPHAGMIPAELCCP